MSELISIQGRGEDFRRNLLTNVSLLALLGATCASTVVQAASDKSGPTVWIEIGGQLERLDAPQVDFAPPFFGVASPPVLDTMLGALRPSRYSSSVEGKITLMPEVTDWMLSAAIRYGQVKNARHLHYQTPSAIFTTNRLGQGPVVSRPTQKIFGDGQTDFADSHFVLDFQAGKDVGLGLFGNGVTSIVSAGVRYAQFTSSSDATIHARPVVGYGPARPVTLLKYHGTKHPLFRQTYTAVLHTSRNTHAIGPSVSWDASLPVIGSHEGMTMAFDWGLNGAILFGRQRAFTQHQTSGHYNHPEKTPARVRNYAQSTNHARSQMIAVPNVGGFAGLSLKFPNAKISLGYRGDFFFNATDSGLDARDTTNRNFYGPFATISIGLSG